MLSSALCRYHVFTWQTYIDAGQTRHIEKEKNVNVREETIEIRIHNGPGKGVLG